MARDVATGDVITTARRRRRRAGRAGDSVRSGEVSIAPRTPAMRTRANILMRESRHMHSRTDLAKSSSLAGAVSELPPSAIVVAGVFPLGPFESETDCVHLSFAKGR